MTEPQPSAHHTVSAMKIPQLSVFLENRPGSLLPPLQLLAEAGLNLAGLSLADTAQFGILRLVLRDWARARELLERGGWVVKLNDMVAIDVDDAPGGLVRALEVLTAAGKDIEYMYAFYLRRDGRVVLLFRFDDPDGAIAALDDAGIAMLPARVLLGE